MDETPIDLKYESGYIWVFSNNEEVISFYKPTREGDFIKEYLKDFKGILVSDFYTAYDSIECEQQKCLIHLIRNMNDELIKNPFDEELKYFFKNFTTLIQRIIKTVDRFGLKKRNLNKHKKEVDKFYKFVVNRNFKSEVTLKFQKNFLKYKNALFLFLSHDNISWNNINAEHAIRFLATHTNKNLIHFRVSRIQDYLKIMSIFQTCKYKEISFLQFLLSREKDIDKYYEKVIKIN